MLHIATRDIPTMDIRQGCPLYGHQNQPMRMVALPSREIMLSAPHVMPVVHHSGLRFSICNQRQIDSKLAYGYEHRMLDARGHVVFQDDTQKTTYKTFCGNTFLGVMRDTWTLVECTRPHEKEEKGHLYTRKSIWDGYASVRGSTRIEEGDVLPMYLPDGHSWIVSWTVTREWGDMDPDDPPPPCDMDCTLEELCSDVDARAWGQYVSLPLVNG